MTFERNVCDAADDEGAVVLGALHPFPRSRNRDALSGRNSFGQAGSHLSDGLRLGTGSAAPLALSGASAGEAAGSHDVRRLGDVSNGAKIERDPLGRKETERPTEIERPPPKLTDPGLDADVHFRGDRDEPGDDAGDGAAHLAVVGRRVEARGQQRDMRRQGFDPFEPRLRARSGEADDFR